MYCLISMKTKHHKNISYILPNWPAPKNVRAVSTLRTGGVSQMPYASFNLATHVGDDPAHVAQNRSRLQTDLQLKQSPVWLNQTHSSQIIMLTQNQPYHTPPDADGAYTQAPDCICTVLTADCLPILLCDQAGSLVCALHVGWRGLCAGIIEQAITILPADPATLLAWIAPGIGFAAFEIGNDVKAQLASHPSAPKTAFMKNPTGQYHANLPALAVARLVHSGMLKAHCFGGNHCTFSDEKRYYSHRRDSQLQQQQTGRQASLIWLK